MKVAVYFNLHKKVFSVKALTGQLKGLVIYHSDYVELTNCTFKVSQAGRNRVLLENRKNVHAFVVGDLATLDYSEPSGEIATYNPYKYNTFVKSGCKTPIHSADKVQLYVKDKKGIIFYETK
jgi:hypothetical protein